MSNRLVVILIRSLGRGGAETQLVNLAYGLKKRGVCLKIVVFYGGGYHENLLADREIEVVRLQKKNRWDLFLFLLRWIKFVNLHKPHVVYSFLTEANLVSLTAKLARPRTKVYWGVRTSVEDHVLRPADTLVAIEYKVARILSTLPDGIIANSRAGREQLKTSGFNTKEILVVENGVDTSVFFPSARERDAVRKEYGVGKNKFLIGIVARLDPIKNHERFIDAAMDYLEENEDVLFWVIGDGDSSYRASLESRSAKLGLDSYVKFLGGQTNLRRIYNALDLTSLCSRSEAFPNVLIESLACETLCVAQNVGDVGRILEKPEYLLEGSSSKELAIRWRWFRAKNDDERKADAIHARNRVESVFSSDRMVEKTMRLLVGCNLN